MYSGDQVDSMDERVLLGIIQDATVFYRVSPRHKLRIVKVSLFIDYMKFVKDNLPKIFQNISCFIPQFKVLFVPVY